ncbi:hypothetical protein CFC21_090221 [Triticum aestivum]|uniref:PGG domain-containing protein n=2 Tax=Triticum aestivum TaxID=4565 RepID=A0A3B6PT28_WHEAT|nr:hypothetical protein CFC21_090221 [Triticum aestivum]
MSEEMAMPGRSRVIGDSSQSDQETSIDHSTHMSVDELLKAIKGANGMPVLLVPSSNGRLTVVAVNGLQNLVLTNHDNKGSAKTRQQNFRAWLLFLASLVATVTFTAGLTPPGGFWSDDNGHRAGDPIMRDKFPTRYRIYVKSNMTAFCFSLVIIGLLANNPANRANRFVRNFYFPFLVLICLLSLMISFISGTWNYSSADFSSCFMFGVALFQLACFWALGFVHKIRRPMQPTESSA